MTTRILLDPERWEDICAAIHAAAAKAGADYWGRRRAVAHAFRYEDAKFIVRKMFSTLGFPLEESADWAGAHGLHLDRGGIEHELLMLGMPPRSAAIAIERMANAHAMAERDAKLQGDRPWNQGTTGAPGA